MVINNFDEDEDDDVEEDNNDDEDNDGLACPNRSAARVNKGDLKENSNQCCVFSYI